MTPTLLRAGSYRLFFFSREEPRIHVHIQHPDGEAKFWITPAVHLAENKGLSATQLNQAKSIIEVNLQEIHHAWRHHFGV